MSLAFLVWTLPNGERRRYPLNRDEFIVGRKAPADLVLPLPRISRQHARLRRTPSGYDLTDLGSRNGTFVNGQAVGATPRRLVGGDEIVLGGAVTLHFYDPEETVQGPRLGRLQGVWIDEETRDVWVDARPVEPPLSPAQFALLTLLYRAEGRIVSRQEVIAAVWPDVDPAGVSEEAVNGLIKRLRQRLRQAQPERQYLQVLRGHGLRLNAPP